MMRFLKNTRQRDSLVGVSLTGASRHCVRFIPTPSDSQEFALDIDSEASDLSEGDVLCLRKPLQPLVAGSRQGGELDPLSQLLDYDGGRATPLHVAAVRFVDALAGWKAGRDYLAMFPTDGLAGLVVAVFNIFSQGGLMTGALDEGEVLLTVGRRHAVSAMQRLSVEPKACMAICQIEGAVANLAKMVVEGAQAKQPNIPDTGTLRFASALLLNFIVALSNENGDGSGFFEDAQAMRDIASALCSVMELDAPAGSGRDVGGEHAAQDDRWGRRYASSAMYAFVAKSSVRKACMDSDRGT